MDIIIIAFGLLVALIVVPLIVIAGALIWDILQTLFMIIFSKMFLFFALFLGVLILLHFLKI